MKEIFSKIGRLHWPLFFLILALCGASIAFIYSATYFSEGTEFRNAWMNQIYWLVIGLAVFFVVALVDYHVWIEHAWIFYLVSLVLLVAVLLFGTSMYGAKRWLPIPHVTTIQPSEVAKPAYILMLVWLLCKIPNRGFKMCAITCGFVGIPFLLIKMQPDLGSGAVLLPISLILLFIAGVKKRYILVPILLVVGLVGFTYFGVHKMGMKIPGLKQYQMERIETFYNPDFDKLGKGWMTKQSLIAIGSGGLTGKGYLKGTQAMLGYLPKNTSYNDFVFASIGEEGGFRTGALVIIGLGAAFTLCLYVSSQAADNAGALLAAGVSTLLFTHFFVNIGMTMRVVPVTGIPLPFMSYGGTFLVICFSMIGLVQSVWIHRRTR
ncbi:rod shape determining protein RodA [Verrucomicrobium sp. GAS474]|uniref:FtsW/RodA/SpoVE family cell cycle protein n=1 Tax=Verrucomicrobium sp. GAS474 TaxID=1882831 RepID=UPI00087DA605|nr:FtsW/RodA/SpoVE family cell cycle protein [Verrucomicrobium sp. GAS474]SDU24378.1 rod shape determining protein RodA [Verrucomicrobium sp. GAS474]